MLIFKLWRMQQGGCNFAPDDLDIEIWEDLADLREAIRRHAE